MQQKLKKSKSYNKSVVMLQAGMINEHTNQNFVFIIVGLSFVASVDTFHQGNYMNKVKSIWKMKAENLRNLKKKSFDNLIILKRVHLLKTKYSTSKKYKTFFLHIGTSCFCNGFTILQKIVINIAKDHPINISTKLGFN